MLIYGGRQAAHDIGVGFGNLFVKLFGNLFECGLWLVLVCKKLGYDFSDDSMCGLLTTGAFDCGDGRQPTGLAPLAQHERESNRQRRTAHPKPPNCYFRRGTNPSRIMKSEPQPINFESIAAGAGDAPAEFPIGCLPMPMRAMVMATAKQTRTPHSMSATVAIATISAAIGRSLTVKSGGGRRTTANLYVQAIAASGDGKGNTFNLVVRPLYEAEARAIEEWKRSKISNLLASIDVVKQQEKRMIAKVKSEMDPGTKHQLVKSLEALTREKQILMEKLDSCPCYVVGDITREALAAKLKTQPGEALACFSSEARGIFGVIRGRYSQGTFSDEDFFLSSYSGDSINVNRKGSPPISLRHPTLAILWMTQPDAARGMFEDVRMTVSGLMPRFLICWPILEPQHEPEVWPEMNPTVVQLWDRLVNDVLEYRASRVEPDVIEATAEARAVLRAFHNQAVDRRRIGGDLRDISAYVERWAENAWRLSLVLHVAKHGTAAARGPVDEQTAKDAVTIMNWFIAQQLAILDGYRLTQPNCGLRSFCVFCVKPADQKPWAS